MIASRIKWNRAFYIHKELTCFLIVRKSHFGVKSRSSLSIYQNTYNHNTYNSVCCFSKQITNRSILNNDSKGSDIDLNIKTSDVLLKNINYQEIVGNDDALLKKLNVLILEIDIMRQDGFGVPTKISSEQWKELLNAPTRSQRNKLISFLFKNEKKREKDIIKKENKRKLRDIKKEQYAKQREENQHINYGFNGSTIFLRIYDTKIDSLFNANLVKAMQFGQDLVLDCSYDEHMTPREASLCAKQLMIVFAENRKHSDPFNLQFCNVDPQTKLMKKLNGLIPTLYDDDFPLNLSNKSYLDTFPKERLVYLTPHCREDLKTFNHDDIYIIGGMVDKVSNEQLSLGKAKREGLRMARLPLDRHLLWHIGSKSLTLNQVLLIMLEMKSSGCWEKAFNHVPRRKILMESNMKPSKGPFLYRERIKQLNRF